MPIPVQSYRAKLLLFLCCFFAGCDLCCTVKQISCCLYD
uniref:Uncharacterized protein n=1 Tax=Anguilla anguilla TaxID=7936 RepID=A0A0E9PJ97_ANGAN